MRLSLPRPPKLKDFDLEQHLLKVQHLIEQAIARVLSNDADIDIRHDVNIQGDLTINQGANDDQILALKSSDVAHGYTTGTETDTFMRVSKQSGTLGGVALGAYAEDAALGTVLHMSAWGGTADTTKSTAGRSLIEVLASEHDGANALANITADGNVFGIRAQVGGSFATRWLCDEDGDTWQTGSVTAGTIVVGSGSITDTSGAISFGNENLTTTGTLASGAVTVTGGLTATGAVAVGDTADANVTLGLVLNQGANDDQILALKSSDVAHALTTGGLVPNETDTFFSIGKYSADVGGVHMSAVEQDGGGSSGIVLRISAEGGTADATKSTSAQGLVTVVAAEHDGANAVSNVAANGNVFVVQARASAAYQAKFLVDEDGDFHYDGADGSAFDSYDDAALIRTFALATSKDTIRSEFDDFVGYNEDDLVEAGILGDTVANGGLVNGSQLQRLLVGAAWQNAVLVKELQAQVAGLETEVRRLTP